MSVPEVRRRESEHRRTLVKTAEPLQSSAGAGEFAKEAAKPPADDVGTEFKR